MTDTEFSPGDVVLCKFSGEIFVVTERCAWFKKHEFIARSMVDGATFTFQAQYFKLIHRVSG